MRLIGDLFLISGAFFIFVGALGLVRMPDVYNRIQVGTKAVTLGAIGVLIGLALIYPQWWSKLVVILGFILLTSPASSSALARAFYRSGEPMYEKGSKLDSSKHPSQTSKVKK